MCGASPIRWSGLSAPAYFRLRVTFRWLDASGRRLAAQTLQTPLCHQLELRPDLAVSSIAPPSPVTGSPGEDRYSTEITNRGATRAGRFQVQLTLPAGHMFTQNVASLGPGAQRRVQFVAPACADGDPITVTVDPQLRIDDADRTNNTLTVSCPAPTSS